MVIEMVRNEGDNDRYAVQKEIWDAELSDDDFRGDVELTPSEIEDMDETIKRIGIGRFFKKLRMD